MKWGSVGLQDPIPATPDTMNHIIQSATDDQSHKEKVMIL